MKILIQYNLSAKVRDVENMEGLHNAVQHMYGLAPNSYVLKRFLEDFKDYEDLEESDSLMQNDIVRAIPQPLDLNNSLTFTSQEVNIHPVEIIQQVEPEPSIEPVVDIPLPRKPWPKEIIIPFDNFSKPLKDCLSSKGNLNWDLSRELVGHLANLVCDYTSYPSNFQRLEVCQSLMHMFPHLRNEFTDGVHGWEKKLLNKLKKMRQGNNSVETKTIREKCKIPNSNVPRKIKGIASKGELNWAPTHVDGESVETCAFHATTMRNEMTKLYPDQGKIANLMALTYSFRRQKINEKVLVQDLLAEYPAFFEINHQYDEFHRLTGIGIRDIFFPEAEKHGLNLFRFFQRKKKNGEDTALLQTIEDSLQDLPSQRRVEAEIAYGLSLLPHLLKDQKYGLYEYVSFPLV